MRELTPRFQQGGGDGFYKLQTSNAPDIDEDQDISFNVNTSSIDDLTGFSTDDTDKQIKLRRILVCDSDGNQYSMIVVGSALTAL